MTRRDIARAAGALLAAAGLPFSSETTGDPITGVDSRPIVEDFPILRERVNGLPLTYLDSAATTLRPNAVVDAIAGFYRHHNANPGRALHALARRAFTLYEESRATVAAFLNADVEEIVWTRGTTEGINLVATAWARSTLRRGDEVLLTIAEHASNLLPWRLVAEQVGAVVRFVDVDDEGRLDLEDLARQLTPRTRLVAFSHVSNVTGYVNPAARVCALARSAGSHVFIDAAQSAPHVGLDVRALGCDFLAFSGHKLLGPMGVGVLWARREVLERMPPYQSGSNMAHAIDVGSQVFEADARKFGAGTPNVAGAVGLAAAISYLSRLGIGEMNRHEAALTAHALARLESVPGLRLLGPHRAENRIPVFSFSLEGHPPADVLAFLDARGIAVRAGDLSALPLLKRFGVRAAVRASCYIYTSERHIDQLADALQRLIARQRT